MKIVGSARCGATEDGLAHPAMDCRVIFLSLEMLVNGNHQGDNRYDEYSEGYHQRDGLIYRHIIPPPFLTE